MTETSESWVIHNLNFILFLGLLTMLYIANAHYAERKVREIQTLQTEIRQLRSGYMQAKADMMFRCKQSEIQALVKPIGLEEQTEPPKKLLVKE